MDMISNELTNKTILVTGAGGSMDQKFVDKFVISIQNVLFLLGHGENSIYLINRELRNRLEKMLISFLL